MRTLAVSNQKGGSGKTTTAVNLAAALAEAGRRVLLVDLDAQGSASRWLGVEDPGNSLLRVFVEGAAVIDVARSTTAPGVDLLPSSPLFAGAERALSQEVAAETILRGQLGAVPAGRWDDVLLDCPPALGLVTLNALTAADAVLAPVETHALAFGGVVQLLKMLEVVQRRLNPGLELCGIVACRYDGRTREARSVLAELRSRFPGQVCETVIHENVRLAEAPARALPIIAYDSGGRGATEYRALAREVLARDGGSRGRATLPVAAEVGLPA